MQGLSISAFAADRWNPRGVSVTVSAASPHRTTIADATMGGDPPQTPRHLIGPAPDSLPSRSESRLMLHCVQTAGRKSC